jgi:hypothetical protein
VTNQRHHRREPDATEGVAGNERLAALTGIVLLIGFAIEGMTLLALHGLLTLHFFLGMPFVIVTSLAVLGSGVLLGIAVH